MTISPEVDPESQLTTQEWGERLPKTKKCATCDTKCSGAHWHDIEGQRASYCTHMCCPSCKETK